MRPLARRADGGRDRSAQLLPPLAFVMTGRSSAPDPPRAWRASSPSRPGSPSWNASCARRAGSRRVSVAASLLALYGTGLLWHEVVEPGRTAVAFVAGTLLVRAWGGRAGGSRADAIARGGSARMALAGLAFVTDAAAGLAPVPGSSVAARQPLLVAPRPPLLGARADDRGPRSRPARGTRTPRGPGRAHRPRRPRSRERQPPPLVERPLRQRALRSRAAALRPRSGRDPGSRAHGGAAAAAAPGRLRRRARSCLEPPPDGAVPRGAHPPRRHRLLPGRGREQRAAPQRGWRAHPRPGPRTGSSRRGRTCPPPATTSSAGQDVLADGSGHIDVGDLGREAWLGEGWSVRHPCGASVCREVEGRARLFLPVVDARPAVVSVRAQGSGTLRVTLERPPARTGRARRGLRGASEAVADGGLVRRGPNVLVLEVSPGGQALVDVVRVAPLGGGAMNLEEYGRMYEAEETPVVVRGHARHQPRPSSPREWPDGGAEAGASSTPAAARATISPTSAAWAARSAWTSPTRRLRFCRSRGVAAAARQPPVPALPGRTLRRASRRSTCSTTAGWRTTGRPCARSSRVAAAGRPLPRARARPEDAVGRPRRGRALAPSLHARRGAARCSKARGSRSLRLTYANTLLFPVLAARRTLDRLLHRHGSDVGFLPAPLEWAFRNLLGVEARAGAASRPARRAPASSRWRASRARPRRRPAVRIAGMWRGDA